MAACFSAADSLRGEGPTLIPIGRLARRVPGLKRHAHPATLHRWATVGLKLPDGSRIFLETRWVGAQRCSTVEWLAAFLDTIDAVRSGRSVPVGVAPARSSEAASEAEAELIAKGW